MPKGSSVAADAHTLCDMDLRTLRTILDDIAEAAPPNSEVIVMTSAGEPVEIRSVLPVYGDITKIYIRCRSSL